MKTKECFVVGHGSKGNRDCWFVRHSKINNGKAKPVNSGELENELRKLLKQMEG